MDVYPVYLVIKKTGQLDPDGNELCIVYAAKLTKVAADKLSERNPGTEVIKLKADKSP